MDYKGYYIEERRPGLFVVFRNYGDWLNGGDPLVTADSVEGAENFIDGKGQLKEVVISGEVEKDFATLVSDMTFPTKAETARHYAFWFYIPALSAWRAPIDANDPRWQDILPRLVRPVDLEGKKIHLVDFPGEVFTLHYAGWGDQWIVVNDEGEDILWVSGEKAKPYLI